MILTEWIPKRPRIAAGFLGGLAAMLTMMVLIPASAASAADDPPAASGQAQDALAGPSVVYRADTAKPDDIRRQGGFFPRGLAGAQPGRPLPNQSLYEHVIGTEGGSRDDTAFVSTTKSRTFARSFLHNYFSDNGYIYEIRPTPNFVDASATLGHFSPHPEEAEFASLGKIHFGQVIAWTRVKDGIEEQRITNNSYDHRFDLVSSSGGQPQFAGFPPGHSAWIAKPSTGIVSPEPPILPCPLDGSAFSEPRGS